MTHAEIAKKIIGPIDPVGDTNIDAERLSNLRAVCELILSLTYEVKAVATNRSSQELSTMMIGKYAYAFLKDLELECAT